jgi:thiamine biosynthesis lipoprotein ApbE
MLVDGGGGGPSLICMRQYDRPWEIGIAHPRKSGQFYELVSSIDKANATSGDYQNCYTSDYRYHHTTDPKQVSRFLELAQHYSAVIPPVLMP